jgi:hypothetical protein
VLLVSRGVCSLRVLHLAPHLQDSGRSLPVPEHAIQFRVCARCHRPLVTLPFQASPPQQDLPITFL